MYYDAITGVGTIREETSTISITVSLFNPTWSQYLFPLVMNSLTWHIQYKVSWCILLVDDIILIRETRVKINYNWDNEEKC